MDTVRHLNRAEAGANEELASVVDAILGADPFVDPDPHLILEIVRTLLDSLASRPEEVATRGARLVAEVLRILSGASELAPEPTDKRFTDPTWSENPFYRRLMQAYLAWRAAMLELVPKDTDGDWRTAAQLRFGMTLLTEALAPTNGLWGNPAALKRAFETGGLSLVRGWRNFFGDLWSNGGMPQQVDKRGFEVGVNLAVTPGAVIHRSELFELIQYRPATEEVRARPLLLVPPQINKFYVMDLAPGRSLTEYAVAHGIQFFTMSWRDATPTDRDWGLDEYVGACKEALEVVLEVTGSADANLLGVCAGGTTSSLLLGHLAATGDQRVNAATLLVTMLDSGARSMSAMFTTESAVAAAVARSSACGVLEGRSMARMFAWLRPNDLVWNYWVNNYLMGKDPAPFDILFWNSDSTNLPAALHAGYMDLLLRNPLLKDGGVTVLGTPVGLREVKSEMYLVGGATDHIVAWRACHHAARLFGASARFVLNSSGHVQTLVCPPANPKAKYYTNVELGNDPDQWLRGATEQKGTWWDDWLCWLKERSGEERPAPHALGSLRFRPIEPAPGRYVHGRAADPRPHLLPVLRPPRKAGDKEEAAPQRGTAFGVLKKAPA